MVDSADGKVGKVGEEGVEVAGGGEVAEDDLGAVLQDIAVSGLGAGDGDAFGEEGCHEQEAPGLDCGVQFVRWTLPKGAGQHVDDGGLSTQQELEHILLQWALETANDAPLPIADALRPGIASQKRRGWHPPRCQKGHLAGQAQQVLIAECVHLCHRYCASLFKSACFVL